MNIDTKNTIAEKDLVFRGTHLADFWLIYASLVITYELLIPLGFYSFRYLAIKWLRFHGESGRYSHYYALHFIGTHILHVNRAKAEFIR